MIWSLIVVLLVLWGVVAGMKVRSAYQNANSARDLLKEFKADNGGLSDLEPFTDRPDLTKATAAGDHFSAAAAQLGSPVVAPLRLVPVLGRQLGVARTLASSGSSLIDAVSSTFDQVTAILDDLQSEPADRRVARRTTATADLARSLSRLASDLRGLDPGTDEGLTGALWRARSEFIDNRDSLVSVLDDAATTMTGVNVFLSGPNTYVVLAANNSEMRAGSGMYLQASSMQITDGRFEVGPFDATEHMRLSEPAGPFDPDLDPIWHEFLPTSEWRNINLTARFDVSGRVATEMWQAMGNPEPQGAMALDIVALQRLLEVVGAVEVEGPTGTPIHLDADNVVEYLLLGQYTQRTPDGELVDRSERRSSLGDVARAAFDQLNGDDVGLTDLVKAFRDMGTGRHLLIWSSDEHQQAAWQALGVSGELDEDDLLVSVINRGNNKLDQFLHVSADLAAGEPRGGSRDLTVSLALSNETPEGLPSYVAGSTGIPEISPGDYKGYLTINLPRGARSIRADGAELVATAGDGDTKLAVIRVIIPRSEDLKVDVSFTVHESWSTVRVLPSARVPGIEWHHAGRTWNDARPHVVTF